ncbi:hypothetical protein KKE60_07410, partial [Patescibacteria group bacterium]|nr:hypothetical protein [Patescibacteria group bacterium]
PQEALVRRYMEMAAETIYAQLPDQLGGETLDNHDVWEERSEEREGKYLPNYPEQDREAKAEQSEPRETTDNEELEVEAKLAEQAEPRETTDNEELEVEAKLAEQAEPQGASSEQVWKQRVAQAANQARMQGKLPGHLATLVEEVLYPTVDWRDLLRDFVQTAAKNDYRLMPPNKRYLWWPMYLPSLKGEHLEIAIAIDTSGSIWNKLLAKFYSEVRGIALEYESWVIHLFLCDAQMHDYRAISSEDEDEDWPKEMKGRGGTSFVPVFEAIEEKGLWPSCLVYLTDLAGIFPQGAPDYPVIWLTTRPEADVPFGDKIHMEETRK